MAGTKDGARRVIRKSNDLIEAKYKLSLEEQKIVAYLASAIKWDDSDFRTVNIPVAEFCECVGIRKDQFYHAFIEMSKKLIERALIVKKGDVTTIVPWLARAKYQEGKGYISLTFSEELRPHLLQLKGCYTAYHADNIMKLKSIYTFRIYELLKQYKKFGWRELDIEELKDMLGIGDMYKNYTGFKTFAIERAKTEMKDKCDIYFEYSEIRHGRQVIAIHFDIFPNEAVHNSKFSGPLLKDHSAPKQSVQTQDEEPEPPQPICNLKTLLSFMDSGYGVVKFNYNNLRDIYKNAKTDVDVIHFCYNVMLDRENVDNPTGWMIKAVRNPEEYGYDRNAATQPEPKKASKPRSRGKKNPFVNFNQRENDHEELERLELEQFKKDLEKIKNKADQPDSADLFTKTEAKMPRPRPVKKDAKKSKYDLPGDDDFDFD